MKKYIYLLAIGIAFASCKHPTKDPEPVNQNPQEPQKPTIQLKQLIARNNITGNNVMLDYTMNFSYGENGFVNNIITDAVYQTGIKYSKINHTLIYDGAKIISSSYFTVFYSESPSKQRDPSKYDTTWVNTAIIYEGSQVTLKKTTINTNHLANLPTTTYEDKEKDFVYIELDNQNRMSKLWNNSGQTQGFEYDDSGNYLKTSILSGKNPVYYLSFKYDDKPNILSQILPFPFFTRIITLPFFADYIACSNNITILNISDSNPFGFEYTYEYNSEGYPTKRIPVVNSQNAIALEYIY